MSDKNDHLSRKNDIEPIAKNIQKVKILHKIIKINRSKNHKIQEKNHTEFM